MTYFSKFFAVFLLFELLPVPVDLDVLLMRLDDFVLDLVSSLLFVTLLGRASLLVCFFSIDLDLHDLFFGASSDLLQDAYTARKAAHEAPNHRQNTTKSSQREYPRSLDVSLESLLLSYVAKMKLLARLTLGFLNALVTVGGDLDALWHDLLVGF